MVFGFLIPSSRSVLPITNTRPTQNYTTAWPSLMLRKILEFIVFGMYASIEVVCDVVNQKK